MPLPGGTSDKTGNSYERRWTVWALIELLAGRAVVAHRSPRGCRDTGAEFRLVVGAQAQWHQAKRQRAGGPWTVSALAATDGVLQAWWPKLSVGDRCVCVSGAGASELTERAAAAADWQEVSTEFLKEKEPAAHFRQLPSAWSDPAEAEVYRAVHSVDVRTIDEKQLG